MENDNKILYSFDTSAFIDSWRRWYSPDVFSTLWQQLSSLIEEGKIIACDEVKLELHYKDDELYKWAMAQKSLFQTITTEQLLTAQQIVHKFQGIVDTNKKFADADAFVIALAKINNCPVVTYESRKNNHKDKLKIPYVCDKLGVDCLNFIDFMRKQGWRY